MFQNYGSIYAITATPSSDNKLKPSLNARNIRFIALGSAIGTELFYGTMEAI